MTQRAQHANAYAGRTLKYWRKYRGMSRRQLGEASGFSTSQIQSYEDNESRISVGAALILCEPLGIGLDDLFEGFEDTQSAPGA